MLIIVPTEFGHEGMTSTNQTWNIVQFCFDLAVERMAKNDLSSDAGNLQLATVYWIRHTGIAELTLIFMSAIAVQAKNRLKRSETKS